jgi:hypothetical protein
MQHTIFSTGSDSYLISQIIHAGPVGEFDEQKRKSDYTHFFRITTTRGAVFCHFKNKESARKSRGVLETMVNRSERRFFQSKGDCIDVSHIISFGKVLPLKNNEVETFGFPVNIQTVVEKSSTVWLTFQSEESAQNVRRALYAAIMSYYEPKDNDSMPPENGLEAVSVKENESELTYVEV